MAKSLLEQMKQTGLVDNTKAQKLKHSQYKNKKQKTRKGTPEQLDETKRIVKKTQAQKMARDLQRNREIKKEAEDKAIAAQIRQLIETNFIEDHDGDIVYNFTDANVVKKINVSEPIYKHLMSGRLLVAKLDAGYELIPGPVAEKIKQRDAASIIINEHDNSPGQDGDDPYSDYKIPDDLMW